MSILNNTTNETTSISADIRFSYSLRVWLYLVPNVLSIFCSIFVLYHFLFDRTLRTAVYNHIIIILIFIGLIYELTDILWIIHFYHFHFTLIQTPAFALLWIFIDYTFWTSQLMLFAWATIERHILIFDGHWVSTRNKRILVHYLPITLILTYCLGYFSIIFLAPTCVNTFSYTQLYGMTSVPCIFKNPIIPKWGWIVNQILPTFIIIFFSLGLLLRVILQKYRLRRLLNWRKERKMFIQLLSVSVIYFVFYMPYALLHLAYYLGLSKTIATDLAFYTNFFMYYVIFLFPLVACSSLPQLGVKIKKLFCLSSSTTTISSSYRLAKL